MLVNSIVNAYILIYDGLSLTTKTFTIILFATVTWRDIFVQYSMCLSVIPPKYPTKFENIFNNKKILMAEYYVPETVLSTLCINSSLICVVVLLFSFCKIDNN